MPGLYDCISNPEAINNMYNGSASVLTSLAIESIRLDYQGYNMFVNWIANRTPDRIPKKWSEKEAIKGTYIEIAFWGVEEVFIRRWDMRMVFEVAAEKRAQNWNLTLNSGTDKALIGCSFIRARIQHIGPWWEESVEPWWRERHFYRKHG